MAKRRKTHHKRRTTRALSSKTTHRRRRRRMSAGTGMFKMFSDPLVGGLAGAVAGAALKNLAAKMMKDNKMIGTAAPLAVAFFLRKKLPFVAAGMAGGPVVALLASKLPFLADEGNITFVPDSLLNDGSPLFLSEDGEPLLLSENGWTLQDDDNPLFMNDDDYDN